MTQGSRILASAHYVPNNVIDNDELAQIMPTSDAWIQKHTGIKTRHISLEGENTSDLATKAAQKALIQAGLSANDIDLIIVATFTPDGLAPSTAALVQRNIGASKAFAYDISTACAGFIFALSTADKFLQTANYDRVLVIAAEVNSKMMDFTDRTSAVFFGDGAAAFVLGASEDGVLAAESLHTIGNDRVVQSGKIPPLKELKADNYPEITAFHQEGREVFSEVLRLIPTHIKTFLADNALVPADIDYFVLHQANLRIIEALADELGQPLEKFAQNVIKYGNTSAAGIAIGLDEYRTNNDLTGKRILLTGFGAGFTYGSILLTF
ncbi:3-oxoacyl-[acyl-carrier-protein] synthase [Weissella oryzae SG25]|uniref:Beta-ketoacyl-[acyl-carrier-protein] synthase III n=1 Tax=Weissella oryzae (strain DSM 25784 / JCM 18191 / LMG 30913 / SG25) TaxID=1329250 RepID=A0A069D244_WEIOS|nr:beta-ketoacyl-ACP synthase III [Weissella oryzae]GAK31461.1 3-oxoacyl-[acyl-carrier-protein] synthase [Weissella oryzae SG25]